MPFRNHLFAAVLVLGLLSSGPAGSTASAQSSDCLGDAPLLSVDIPDPLAPGEWRLPVSPNRPEILTEARVRLELTQSRESGWWTAWLYFTFPDPKPWGLPFSFQKAELTWGQSESPDRSAEVDWSHECSGPGMSLYPRQERSGSIEIQNIADPSALSGARFKIWGSRN